MIKKIWVHLWCVICTIPETLSICANNWLISQEPRRNMSCNFLRTTLFFVLYCLQVTYQQFEFNPWSRKATNWIGKLIWQKETCYICLIILWIKYKNYLISYKYKLLPLCYYLVSKKIIKKKVIQHQYIWANYTHLLYI